MDARPDAEAVIVFLSRELLNRFKCILFFTLKLKMAFFKVSGNVRANISPRILSRWRLNRVKFLPHSLSDHLRLFFQHLAKHWKKSEWDWSRKKKASRWTNLKRYESIIYSTLIIGFSLLPLRRKFSSEIPIFLKAVFVASNLDQLLLVAWPFAEVTIRRVLAGFGWLEMYMSAWLWAKLLSWQIIELKS